ncbi:hypothetical protein FKX85_09545 [Echinicola soli]|uniref:Uncharacterized protein n=1 Tax=Echinicola soli TaxID=2591634 RepID=A0A514CHG2_9BACT|nr:hypothetical protein [Echinicola soli]QDH79262.1 hypothetical protein FKX85_09545 [Echinicola soli]
MNRIKWLILLACITNCNGISDYDWKTTTKITFINETSEIISVVGGGDCKESDILPNSTQQYVHKQLQSGNSKRDKPNLNNLSVFIPCSFFYGDTGKCETDVNTVEEWEDLKQTGELEFEFTFRFTEEKKEKAEECN